MREILEVEKGASTSLQGREARSSRAIFRSLLRNKHRCQATKDATSRDHLIDRSSRLCRTTLCQQLTLPKGDLLAEGVKQGIGFKFQCPTESYPGIRAGHRNGLAKLLFEKICGQKVWSARRLAFRFARFRSCCLPTADGSTGWPLSRTQECPPEKTSSAGWL